MPIIERLLEKDERPAPRFVMDKDITDFYQFTRDSFSLEGYDPSPSRTRSRWPSEGTGMVAIVAVDARWGHRAGQRTAVSHQR